MNAPATYPAAPRQPELDTPLVSVIVPVYNIERYLPQHLDSILAQDYRNLDILLVDACSTGGCVAMCDSCASRDPWPTCRSSPRLATQSVSFCSLT